MRRLALLLLVGCSAAPTLPFRQRLVVRAYVYANEPVTDIEVASVVPLTSADTVGAPVSNATVTLTRRGVVYTLSESASAAGRYSYEGTDLAVTVGDTLDLAVVHDGGSVTARAIVPRPPAGLAISATLLTVDTTSVPPALTAPIVVRWSNPNKDFFFTVIDAVDAHLVPIPRSACSVCVTTSSSVTSAPTQSDSAIVDFRAVHFFGRQRVRLYRVPPEYAALYNSRQQDSRDLNEPATNVRGGLGIFSAFAGDSTFFNVIGGS